VSAAVAARSLQATRRRRRRRRTGERERERERDTHTHKGEPRKRKGFAELDGKCKGCCRSSSDCRSGWFGVVTAD